MTRKKNRKLTYEQATVTMTGASPTIVDMTGKPGKGSMSPKQAHNVRELMKRICQRDFEGNRAMFGRAIHIRGQAVTQILGGTNSPGWQTVSGLQTYLNASWDAVLDGTADSNLKEDSAASVPTKVAGHTMTAEGRVENMAYLLRLRDLPQATFPCLEFALGFYAHEPERWSPATIQAARQGQFDANKCSTWTPPQWVDALDRLEKALRNYELPPTSKPRRLPPHHPHKPGYPRR